ncbi:nucleoside triphosphate pyrophosphohydrolase [Burkholderia gladioli]|uniref:nucleoside triphosphate pyrophosphohydrolase n=1 Tax=Burkholderia gladioli TaxID=28095 RepID=UPI001FC894E7|nr:nucleoside triphosphate pyrophosphohydrolase [Burkholderia gladioli]
MPIQPQCPVTLVNKTGAEIIPATEITKALVGEKAFGLSCIPSAWTLPFVVVASELFAEYSTANKASQAQLVAAWAENLVSALFSIGLTVDAPVWVRSSGITETIADRGRLHSELSTVSEVAQALEICLEQTLLAVRQSDERVCLVVQRAVIAVAAKGHLSDERQHAQEARDWIGEVEAPASPQEPYFRINLRSWRRRENEAAFSRPLQCALRVSISRALEPAAWWAYKRGTRIHFEWVWDGKSVFLVQADEALTLPGFDPTAQTKALQRNNSAKPSLQCLKEISEEHARKFHKIKNVEVYKKLGLPSCPIFVLDDAEIFAELLSGTIRDDLRKDMQALCEYSLVIRTDIETDDQAKRQLLPRTCEERDCEGALRFLRDTLANFANAGVSEPVAFIFHNFIPAVSSAFAYAAPGMRKVHIECLWGLPEGLYYNSHDKIVVDTKKGNVLDASTLDVAKFAIQYKERYKGFCVAPDSNGQWVRMALTEPFDWRRAIGKEEWIREISLQSRRIAEAVGEPLSIMWFVGVPSRFSPKPTFPWYHEPYLVPEQQRQTVRRRKASWDKTIVIESATDVERLRAEAKIERSQVKQIRLQPKDNDLLRNKSLLETVGALAKKIDAVIYLEGGTLSHAYYQLLQTAAQVDIAHPFEFMDETQEFHKLVRDGVPKKITDGGEAAKILRLSGDDLLHALREKLVEEAIEALDARGHDRLLEELADLEEVVDATLAQLKVSRTELNRIKKQKRAASGGFNDGVVLVGTANPSRIGNAVGSGDLFETDASLVAPASLSSMDRRSAVSRRWEDKREHASAVERVLRVSVGLTQDNWTTDSREVTVGERGDAAVRARITGRREGSTMTLEVSVYSLPAQLGLFPPEEDSDTPPAKK